MCTKPCRLRKPQARPDTLWHQKSLSYGSNMGGIQRDAYALTTWHSLQQKVASPLHPVQQTCPFCLRQAFRNRDHCPCIQSWLFFTTDQSSGENMAVRANASTKQRDTRLFPFCHNGYVARLDCKQDFLGRERFQTLELVSSKLNFNIDFKLTEFLINFFASDP